MRSTKGYSIAAIISLFLCLTVSAVAVEIHVQGEGSAPITSKVDEVQYKAKQEATRIAVATALQRILGPDCLKDPKVREKFNDVCSQLGVYKVKQTYDARRENKVYIVTTELILDETKLRELLSDMGIALHTNVVRARAILTITDEFFGKPSDLNLPQKESIVYRYDRDSKYKEDEKQSGREKEAFAISEKDRSAGSFSGRERVSGSASARRQADASGSAKASDAYGSASFGGSASYRDAADASYSGKSSVDSKFSQKRSLDAGYARKSSHDYGHFIDASESEHEYFEKTKEYQHLSKRDKKNYAINSLQSAFQSHDIRILDNDLFRSKYFGDKVITIGELNNSSDLAKYAKFARKDARADFFAIGNSVIIDQGKDKDTDQFTCDGSIFVKVYSTLDAETIASGLITEQAAGNSPDQCRAKVANKVGKALGNVISSKIQGYWKKRQMYGGEYVLTLVGSFPAMTRIQFTKVVKNIEGVSNVTQRRMDDKELEFIITYNGSESLVDSIFMRLASSPIASNFSNYDYSTEGNQIKLHPFAGKGTINK